MLYGVTYPEGFRAAGICAGIKKNNKLDLAAIISDRPASAAALFTKNVIKGHSLLLSRKHISCGTARLVLMNSGCANACLGERGEMDALRYAMAGAQAVGCPVNHVLPQSTGVIGKPLPIDALIQGVHTACTHASKDHGIDAAMAIMTTDTHPKMAQDECIIDGKTVKIGAMAKGSGMIHPNMATMLCLITTDAALTSAAADKALRSAASITLNRISVDGDTSVCDQATLLANGLAGNRMLQVEDPELNRFTEALCDILDKLARMLAADGEGATKLLEIRVRGAENDSAAHIIAASIARSPLCKTAAYGNDANWGRLITAAGYSGVDFNPNTVNIWIGPLMVCENGTALPFSEAEALALLKQKEVVYTLDFRMGKGKDTMYTCDFSHDYISINAEYRT
ncbi:MAG: bifunctional glutamate N-acetyltransferase/amino-acid acetyltransferase ArgJ [Christensenellales bacterium]